MKTSTDLATRGRSFFAAAKSNMGKATAAVTGFAAAGIASAQGTPGSAIAAELTSGKADVMLVVAAAAIIIGVLVLWSYVKRAR